MRTRVESERDVDASSERSCGETVGGEVLVGTSSKNEGDMGHEDGALC